VAFVFLLGVAVFGLWIFSDPIQRGLALAVTAAIIVVAVLSVRSGAFRPRTVVEYRLEATPPPMGILSLVSAGRAIPAQVQVREASGVRNVVAGAVLDEPERIQSIRVDLPAGAAGELLLWDNTGTAD
jgi:hypothetical protein